MVTALPLDSFEQIVALSFVTRSGAGFLCLHNALAKCIRHQIGAETRSSVLKALIEHFEQRAKPASHREFNRDKTREVSRQDAKRQWP